MRNLLNLSLIFAICVVISGCGQSGALMLPSDPNYDKRSNYILHKNTRSENQSIDQNTSSSETEQN